MTMLNSISHKAEVTSTPEKKMIDTIIIAAKEDGFYRVFLGENSWYPVRLGGEKLPVLKWIAVYQTSPISAITHYAKIQKIEPFQDTWRYKITFEEPAELGAPITLGSSGLLSMQGQRYTTIHRLLRAKTIDDLKPWN